MRTAGLVISWFCMGFATFMMLAGVINTFVCGFSGVLLFCAMMAAMFYLAGVLGRRHALRAGNDA
jgi:hypothetical protein